ncbi:class I adenylate-forming enzyme family protein [Enemella sp. A6]|uniref:class I adenylate-forming enzyme family protein n=1 Tax=Enemella sp. A6 TaxID=3440152 RepID=UPI003EC0856C
MAWPEAVAQPFETHLEDVLGEQLEVFVHRPRTLREMLEHTDRFDDVEYLVIDEHRLTYAEVRRMVAALAKALNEQYGVTHGSRVAILGENMVEWLLTFWATTVLGGISVGINSWWSADEIAVYAEDCEPTIIAVSDRMRDHLPDQTPPLVRLDSMIEELITPNLGAAMPDVHIDEDDPVVILYTSGTTGRSKGAVNTHRNAISMVMLQSMARVAKFLADPNSPRDIGATSFPFFHVSGLYGSLLVPLMAGDTSIFLTGKFDAAKVLRAVDAEKCTKISIVPTTGWRIARELQANRDAYDLSTLQRFTGGGAPMTPAMQEALREQIPQIEFAFGYGLTECAGLATGANNEMLQRNPNTAGAPYPTVQLQIWDENDVPQPDGTEGLVMVRGPMVMPGYWDNEAANEKTFAPGHWLRTGDLGTITDGELELTGRRSDLILRGGENVYPAEIEFALENHPAVVEVVVVGVPHPDLGQEVCAHVVVNTETTGEEFTEYLKPRLAYFKVPSKWVIGSDPLPRTASGKILRKQLQS